MYVRKIGEIYALFNPRNIEIPCYYTTEERAETALQLLMQLREIKNDNKGCLERLELQRYSELDFTEALKLTLRSNNGQQTQDRQILH